MSETRTFETTIAAMTRKEWDEEDFQALLEKSGLDSEEEFIKVAEMSAKNSIERVFEEDSLKLLKVRAEEVDNE